MSEAIVRGAVHRMVGQEFADLQPVLVMDELGLNHGSIRVDVAVINGHLHGYEIKAERDSLDRLPAQARTYERVLDFVSVVCAPKHLKPARRILPRFWGLFEAEPAGAETAVQLSKIRAATPNPRVNAIEVAALLWRDEALAELEKLGAAAGLRSRPRDEFYARLVEILPLTQLQSRVREALRVRGQRWRSGPRRR